MSTAASMTIHGFPNVANTCYLNSVLSALLSSVRTSTWINSIEESDSQPVSTFLGLLRDHFHGESKEGTSIHDLCRQFTRLLHKHPKFTLEVGRQNDANEFLLQLLDAVMEEHKNENVPVKAQEPARLRLAQKMEKAWQESVLYPYGDIGTMFHGQMVHQMKCGACSALSHTPEVFTVLTLSFPTRQTKVCVSDCVEYSFRNEHITDSWKCEKCSAIASSSVPATKSLRLWRLPQVLVLGFKRFSPTGHKDNAQVIMENEMEESLTRFMCSASPFANDRPEKYRFCGSVHHYGSARFGHYTSLCSIPGLSSGSDEEVRVVDDDNVSSSSEHDSKNLQKSIYMVVFERPLVY